MEERVTHPAWYGGADNPYEAIKVIEAWGAGFCTGNALKYLARAGKKPAADTHEDLKKAVWYLRRSSKFDAVTPLTRRTHAHPMTPEKIAFAWELEAPLAHVLTLIYQGANASAALALEAYLPPVAPPPEAP